MNIEDKIRCEYNPEECDYSVILNIHDVDQLCFECEMLRDRVGELEEKQRKFGKFLKSKIAYYQKCIDNNADDFDFKYECEDILEDYQKFIVTGELPDYEKY